MKVIKLNFNASFTHTKNIKIIIGLLLALLFIIGFTLFKDKDTVITHQEANSLFTEDKIKKLD